MEISSLINEKLVDLNIDARNQKEAIEKLASLLEKEDRFESKKAFVEGVLEREKEITTGLGKGIAIPHCKIDSVKEASIAIGRLKQGVDWNSFDEKPVEFIIMLAIPKKDANTTHLKILSTIATKLMEDEFVEELLSAKDAQKIISLLKI